MLEVTGVTKPEQYVQGWVRDYVDAVRGTRFPLSFHLLSGLWALTSIVGRKARLQRPGFDLYPPISIMLLGDSGVGKSSCMNLALRHIIIPATKDRDGFFAPDGPRITERGLLNPWKKAQENGLVDVIEGAYGFSEAKSLLSRRVGAESIMQFLIDCLDHGAKYDSTGVYGEIVLKGLTISLCICSTLDPLRESVSPGEFVDGGFVHRFFMAHELHRPQDIEEEVPNPETLGALSDRARGIWERAPSHTTLTSEAEKLLKTYKEQSEDRTYDVSSLAGFWNRLGNMTAKMALGFAISEESWVITKTHVERAEKLIRGHLYPPLRGLVLELSFEPSMRRIFKVSEDLYYSGGKGISIKNLTGRLGMSSPKQILERLQMMRDMGLITTIGAHAYHPHFKPSV